MEQSRNAPRVSAITGDSADSYSAFQNQTRLSPERTQQQIIYDESIEIACDWLEATGRPISKEEFKNLFQAGYASNGPSEVEGVFYDWEDYQKVSESYYENPDLKAQKEWELYQALFLEAQSGLLPIELFLRTEGFTTRNPNSSKKRLARYKLTGDYAPSSVALERHYKYLLVGHLLESRAFDQESTEERKVAIVLGFTPSTGKPLSSFLGRLKNSCTGITDQDIRQAAEDLDIYEHVFPESRREHLEELVELGRGPVPPEYYFDLTNQKLLVLGKTALHQFTDEE